MLRERVVLAIAAICEYPEHEVPSSMSLAAEDQWMRLAPLSDVLANTAFADPSAAPYEAEVQGGAPLASAPVADIQRARGTAMAG